MKTKVKDAMHDGVETMPSDASITALAQRMRQHDIGMIAIVDKEKLLGIVTDRDIVVRGLADGRDVNALKARDIMTVDVVSCEPSDGLHRAAKKMASSRVRRLPVVDSGKVVGTLSLGDVSQAKGADERAVLTMLRAVSEHHG
jgi:signal-transduction protein with cAMP-binding, CBS, and nucleotidyltransferase domain